MPEVRINIPKITTIIEMIARYFAHTIIPLINEIVPSTSGSFVSLSTIYDTTEIMPVTISETPTTSEIYSIHLLGNAMNSTPIIAETIIVAIENRFSPFKKSNIKSPLVFLSSLCNYLLCNMFRALFISCKSSSK